MYESRESDVDSITGNLIWKDSSADHVGNYLETPSDPDHFLMRPTVTGATGGHQDITVGLLDDEDTSNGIKSYSGRKRLWPGTLFFILLFAGASFAIAFFGHQEYVTAQAQQEISRQFLVSPNRKPPLAPKVCGIPNFITEKGKLYATNAVNKSEVRFTGINWSGMENKEGIPHGLAYKQSNLDRIAEKLNQMEMNAVRLPLNAKMILNDNIMPDIQNYLARNASSDLLGVSSYMDMIKRVVEGLARQQIGVLLDIHKLDPEYNTTTSEKLWYSDDFPESTMIRMYEKLAKEMCTERGYNIIGIDIKNEPEDGCWPAKDTDTYCPMKRNWPRAVERIGKAILTICPQWILVVEGLAAKNMKRNVSGVETTYSDWIGASLQNASLNPIQLPPPFTNKIVFAPHFYSPSVYPSSYFFAKQSSSPDGAEITVEEYPNTAEGNRALESVVKSILDQAFGHLLDKKNIPVFYGEFGGIYGSRELAKEKTSTRVIDYLIKYADQRGMIGGFSWALNPDGNYDWNDRYVGKSNPRTPWQFGLYKDNQWSEYNEEYAKGLLQLKGTGKIPCFPSSSTSTSTTLAPTTDGSSSTNTSTTITVGG